LLQKYGLTQNKFFASGVNDSADRKIGDFKDEFFGEFESICKKASIRMGPDGVV
jgi:hypothetical protein